MRYDIWDIVTASLAGFIIGFITALIFNILLNINHTTNTDLLCGVLSDNNISNSTVISICRDQK